MFTVAGEGTDDGVALAFSEDRYAIKLGALFDVTVEVAKSDKLIAGLVTLKMLQDDGSEAGTLMQWHSNDKDRMQPPGEAIAAEVEDGKAEFKNLFVVDAKDVTKLQAVLEHKGKLVVTEGDLSSAAGEVQLKEVRVSDQEHNRLQIQLAPPPTDKMISVQIYFYKDNGDKPVTVHGAHDGSGAYSGGLSQEVKESVTDLDEDCYEHLALKLVESGNRYAFLMAITPNFNGNSGCP